MTLCAHRYQIGQIVWITPKEAEYAPFEALIIGVKHELFGGNHYIDKNPSYTIMENPEQFARNGTVGPTSDGWTEDMIGLCPRR